MGWTPATQARHSASLRSPERGSWWVCACASLAPPYKPGLVSSVSVIKKTHALRRNRKTAGALTPALGRGAFESRAVKPGLKAGRESLGDEYGMLEPPLT